MINGKACDFGPVRLPCKPPFNRNYCAPADAINDTMSIYPNSQGVFKEAFGFLKA